MDVWTYNSLPSVHIFESNDIIAKFSSVETNNCQYGVGCSTTGSLRAVQVALKANNLGKQGIHLPLHGLTEQSLTPPYLNVDGVSVTCRYPLIGSFNRSSLQVKPLLVGVFVDIDFQTTPLMPLATGEHIQLFLPGFVADGPVYQADSVDGLSGSKFSAKWVGNKVGLNITFILRCGQNIDSGESISLQLSKSLISIHLLQ